MRPITYTNMSYGEKTRIHAQRKREFAWEEMQRRLDREHKAWEAACARFNESFDDLMATSKKLSQQVTSKLG